MTDAQPNTHPPGESANLATAVPTPRASGSVTGTCGETLWALLAHPVIRGCGWADRLFFRDAACREPRVDPCEAVVFLGAVIAHQAPEASIPDAVQHAGEHLEPARRTFLVANARRHELPLFRAASPT